MRKISRFSSARLTLCHFHGLNPVEGKATKWNGLSLNVINATQRIKRFWTVASSQSTDGGKGSNAPACFIGLTDTETPGTWKWSDGSSVTYTHWPPGEPNSFTGSQHYGAYFWPPDGRAGEWDDADDAQAGALAIIEISNEPLVDVSSSVTLTNPRPDVVGFFGNTITAVGTDKVLVTALFDGVAAPPIPDRDGLAYLFRTNGALLRTFRNPQRDGRFFGHRVAALDASHVFIAASPIFYHSNVESVVHLFSIKASG